VLEGHGIGRVGTFTRLLFGLLAFRVRPHANNDRSPPKVGRPPQLVRLDRGESIYTWA
jgi:hypothetical protein